MTYAPPWRADIMNQRSAKANYVPTVGGVRICTLLIAPDCKANAIGLCWCHTNDVERLLKPQHVVADGCHGLVVGDED